MWNQQGNKLYIESISAESLVEAYGAPLYVYHEGTLRNQIQTLKQSFPGVKLNIHFAMKSNYNPALLQVLREEGACIDAVAPFEVQHALAVGFDAQDILFTGNNIGSEELQFCIDRNVPVNVESLVSLESYGKLNPGSKVSIRINPGIGAGHHGHCITGGPKSKFGIYHDQLDQLPSLLKKYNLQLNGIHSHIGTGILDTEPMMAAMEMTLSIAKDLEGLEFIDFGGGFGIPYHPDQHTLDIADMGSQMAERFCQFVEEYGSPLSMKIEPGRYIVGPAGMLLAEVTNTKHTPQYEYAGISTGFNHLIRPAMYGSYHRIYNASQMDAAEKELVLAGNICETGDVFTQNTDSMSRMLPEVSEGDVVAIADAGAYGISMSSQYNMRPRPAEVLVSSQRHKLIRRRETYEDLVQAFQ